MVYYENNRTSFIMFIVKKKYIYHISLKKKHSVPNKMLCWNSLFFTSLRKRMLLELIGSFLVRAKKIYPCMPGYRTLDQSG